MVTTYFAVHRTVRPKHSSKNAILMEVELNQLCKCLGHSIEHERKSRKIAVRSVVKLNIF